MSTFLGRIHLAFHDFNELHHLQMWRRNLRTTLRSLWPWTCMACHKNMLLPRDQIFGIANKPYYILFVLRCVPQKINTETHTSSIQENSSFASQNNYGHSHKVILKVVQNVNIGYKHLTGVGSSIGNPLVHTILPKHLLLSHFLFLHYWLIYLRQHLKNLSNCGQHANRLVTLLQWH